MSYPLYFIITPINEERKILEMKKKVILAVILSSCIMAGNAYAGEWKTAPSGWWYQKDDGSYFANGWQWINDHCYYFDPNGYCLVNTITPDGYFVDGNGAWVVNGVVQTTANAGTERNVSDIFAKSAGEYYFSSGVGGWSTELTLNPDGSFTGSYSDMDMGSGGVGYMVTIYQSKFHGQFKNPVVVNSYTYKVELDGNIVIDSPNGQYIEDEVLYVSTEPYGMEVGREFYIYLPGAPLSALPEPFVHWALRGTESSAVLPFYGLYNAEGQYGYTSNLTESGSTSRTDLDGMETQGYQSNYLFDIWTLSGEYESENVMPYSLMSISIYSSPEPGSDKVGNYIITVPQAGLENTGELRRDSDKTFSLISYEGDYAKIEVIDDTFGAVVIHYVEDGFECNFRMYEAYGMP